MMRSWFAFRRKLWKAGDPATGAARRGFDFGKLDSDNLKVKAISRLPLNSLRVCEAVARLKSMSRAAEALNVQPSAVSMQMKNLTAYIGLPLVVSAGRGLELTKHGESLLPSVLSGLGQIEERILAMRRTARAQPFTLSVLPGFLHLWLHPRLARFEAAHPQFKLRIVASREH